MELSFNGKTASIKKIHKSVKGGEGYSVYVNHREYLVLRSFGKYKVHARDKDDWEKILVTIDSLEAVEECICHAYDLK